MHARIMKKVVRCSVKEQLSAVFISSKNSPQKRFVDFSLQDFQIFQSL